jgi:hypothetical protein
MLSTRNYSLQGWSDGFSGAFGSLSRDIIKDKLNVALRASMGFHHNGNLKFKGYSEGRDFHYATNLDIDFPHLALTLTYSFGNMKHQVKTHESNIKNDFMQTEKGTGRMGM